MVISEQFDKTLRIRLLPNRSASWQQTRRFLLGISCLAMAIAIIWAAMGIWVILPFAGLEVGLLCFLVYRVSLKTHQQEVLYIEPDIIRLERGSSYPKWTRTFSRQALEFIITNPRHSLSPAIVEIATKGVDFQFGNFLNKEDTEELTEQIRHSGVPYRVTGTTQIHAIEGFEL